MSNTKAWTVYYEKITTKTTAEERRILFLAPKAPNQNMTPRKQSRLHDAVTTWEFTKKNTVFSSSSDESSASRSFDRTSSSVWAAPALVPTPSPPNSSQSTFTTTPTNTTHDKNLINHSDILWANPAPLPTPSGSLDSSICRCQRRHSDPP